MGVSAENVLNFLPRRVVASLQATCRKAETGNGGEEDSLTESSEEESETEEPEETEEEKAKRLEEVKKAWAPFV